MVLINAYNYINLHIEEFKHFYHILYLLTLCKDIAFNILHIYLFFRFNIMKGFLKKSLLEHDRPALKQFADLKKGQIK